MGRNPHPDGGNALKKWTVRQFKQYLESQMSKKRSKYKNVPLKVDGIRFDSRKEANHYLVNKERKKNGELIDFFMQVRYMLPGGVRFYLDFVEIKKGGEIDYVDVKGVRTAVYRIKKRQVEEIYNIKIKEV